MGIRKPLFPASLPAIALAFPQALLLVLLAGSSHAQQPSNGRLERERIRQMSTQPAQPAASDASAQDNHNQCLVLSVETRSTFLVNRCNYPLNVMYCHLKDSSPSGCQGQTISLRSGGSSQTAPGAVQKYRWLACRSPARAVETRWHDGYRIRVEWTCVV